MFVYCLWTPCRRLRWLARQGFSRAGGVQCGDGPVLTQRGTKIRQHHLDLVEENKGTIGNQHQGLYIELIYLNTDYIWIEYILYVWSISPRDPPFVHFQKCSQLVSSTLPALCAYGYLCKGPFSFSALEHVIRLVPSIKHVLQTKNCKIRFHHFGPSVFSSMPLSISKCQLSKLEKLVFFLFNVSPHGEKTYSRAWSFRFLGLPLLSEYLLT